MHSQATFQRLMDNILEGVVRTEAYVDDCCVFSRTVKEHLEDLRDTFTRIREGNVKLRRDKCHFGYSEGEFTHFRRREKTHTWSSGKVHAIPNTSVYNRTPNICGEFELLSELHPQFARIARTLYAHTYEEWSTLDMRKEAPRSHWYTKEEVSVGTHLSCFPRLGQRNLPRGRRQFRRNCSSYVTDRREIGYIETY